MPDPDQLALLLPLTDEPQRIDANIHARAEDEHVVAGGTTKALTNRVETATIRLRHHGAGNAAVG